MVAIAMGLLWAGYTGGLWGYCLVKGYDISFRDLVSPTGWYSGPWPPPTITDPSVILPGGTPGPGIKPLPPGKLPRLPRPRGKIPPLPRVPPPPGRK